MPLSLVASLTGFSWVTAGITAGPQALIFSGGLYINAPTDADAALMRRNGATFEVACSLASAGSLRFIAAYDSQIYGVTSDGKLLSWNGIGSSWTLRATFGTYVQCYGLLVIGANLYAIFDNTNPNVRLHSWNGAVAALVSSFNLLGGESTYSFFAMGCFTLNGNFYVVDRFVRIYIINFGAGRTQVNSDFIDDLTMAEDCRIPIVNGGIAYIPLRGSFLSTKPELVSWDGVSANVVERINTSHGFGLWQNAIAYRTVEADFAVLVRTNDPSFDPSALSSWDGASPADVFLDTPGDAPYTVFYLNGALYVFVARNTTENYLYQWTPAAAGGAGAGFHPFALGGL